jgi:hypothetical protein
MLKCFPEEVPDGAIRPVRPNIPRERDARRFRRPLYIVRVAGRIKNVEKQFLKDARSSTAHENL